MKALAFISTLLCILLAIALGASYYSQNTDDQSQEQELQTAQLRLQTAQRETAQTSEQLRNAQRELERARNTLAEAKTLESGLRLQLAEADRTIRRQSEELLQAAQRYDALQDQHRQLRSELVKLHTSAATSGPEQNLLREYLNEIEQLKAQVRQLQSTGAR